MGIADKRRALQGALRMIEGYDADVIVITDMYLDDVVHLQGGNAVNAGFHTILHDHLVEQIRGNHETVGVVAVKPFDPGRQSLNPVSVTGYVTQLTNVNAGSLSAASVMEAFSSTYGCISVVCGEPRFNTGFGGGYSASSEAAYAGLMTSIKPAESTTNKPVRGTFGMRYTFLRKQHEQLMQARYAIVDQKTPGDAVLVIDGVTSARNNGPQDRSDWVRLSTVRTTFEMLRGVRAIAETYIGSPNTPAVHNTLKHEIQVVVDDYINRGWILDGSSKVVANTADRINGNVFIQLSIVPALEIRRIIVTTSLRPQLDT
jgi:hypothetical protein